MHKRLFLAPMFLAAAACGGTPAGAPTALPKTLVATVDPYHAEIEKFRHDREAKLTSDTGWLTIAGLSFLTKPETTFGSDASNDVVLPTGAPAKAGTFVLAKN